MHICVQCGKKFEKRQHLARHRGRVHPPSRPDTPEDTQSTKESERGHKRPREEGLPGDHWPDSKQLVIATGKAGDLLPWSSQQNIMLLAPSAVCGVLVPRKWTPAMTCGILGVSRRTLRGIRKSSGPNLEALREELKEVLRRYQQPQEEGDAE